MTRHRSCCPRRHSPSRHSPSHHPPQSEGGAFHRKHFTQAILGYARSANFSGNIVFTTRLLGLNNGDKGAAMELLRLAREGGMSASLVDPSEVARSSLSGQLCSSENVHRPCGNGGGHQCTPSVPDVVAWELQKQLVGERHRDPKQ